MIMNFKIKNLVEALNTVGGTLEDKKEVKALLIDIQKDGTCRFLTANRKAMTISKVSFKSKEIEEISVVADYMHIKRVLDGLLVIANTDDDVTIELKENSISFKMGNNINIPASPLLKDDAFIDLEFSTDELINITVDSKLLKEAIDKAGNTYSLDETKLAFTGIYLEYEQNTLSITSADGFRVAHMDIDATAAEGVSCQALIPGKEFVNISKKLSEGEVTLSVSKKVLQVISGDNIFVTLNFEEKYIPYQQILGNSKKTYKTKVIAEKKDFLNAIKFIKAVNSEPKTKVKLDIKDSKMAVYLISEKNQLKDNIVIDIEHEGEDIGICFNADYFKQLFYCDSAKLTLLFAGALQPLLVDDESFLYFTLPIKITNINS